MKRISTTTVTLGVIAVLVALGAAFVARKMMTAQKEVAPPPGASIITADVNLPKGTRIRSEDVSTTPLAPGLTPKEEQITSRSLAVGRMVKEEIPAGKAVLTTSLYPVDEEPSLADDLPAGYRAVTIAVDGNNSQGDLAQRNSLIDIALTVEGNHPDLEGLSGNRGIGTVTLMRAVRVLEAAGGSNRETRLRNASASARLTVAVLPEQANELILAQRYGTLSVTLVSAEETGDAAPAGDSLVTPSTLLKLENKPQPQLTQAVIWRAGSCEVIEFEENLVAEADAATASAERQTPVVPVGISTSAGQ